MNSLLHGVSDRHACKRLERWTRDLLLHPINGLLLEAVVGWHEQVVEHDALLVCLLSEAGCNVALGEEAAVVVDLTNTVLNDLEEDVELVAVGVVSVQQQQRGKIEVTVDNCER